MRGLGRKAHLLRRRLVVAPSAMANQVYQFAIPNFVDPGFTLYLVVHRDISTSSPRVKGKLVLQPNPHSWDHRYATVPQWRRGTSSANPVGRLTGINNALYANFLNRPEMIRITNEALARFTGKVRKHNANLGVTLASWKQSAEMIGNTSKKIATIFDRRISVVEKMSSERRRRLRIQGTAGAFLGVEFGWVPLIQDIRAGLDALSRNPPDPFWVRTSAKAVVPWNWSSPPDTAQPLGIIQNGFEAYSCNVSGRAIVESENTFLANRLGLLNLPGVAWDIVPWSFVFNMFSNMSQMVNSLTDFCGVTIDKSSTTSSVASHIAQQTKPNPGYPDKRDHGYASNEIFYKSRERTLGLPTPKFMWRVPDLNLELVAILAALPLQRLNKLNRLVGYSP